MTDASHLVPLTGSERLVPLHDRVGSPDPTDTTTVTVYLRGPDDPAAGWMAREDYAARHGASDDDVAAIEQFAADHGLTVGAVSRARRSVDLHGGIGALSGAFGTELGLYQPPDGDPYRGRQGPLQLPGELDGVVTGVFGLDQRPQAQTQFRVGQSSTQAFTPPQVAAAYDYPTGLTGTGETIGLIELGGGFRPADLTAYFASLKLTEPTVVAVPVGTGTNSPGAANGPDGEVMLDIEMVGSIAPGATVAVYFAPNTDQGFLDAVTTAVHDTTNKPSVISISWGSAESTWTAQAMQQMEQAFTAAAALGVTVTVAAGDNGSTHGVTDGTQHVDFPASAPHALGCGGTHLQLSGSTITAETVWNDGTTGGATGGGVSDVFAIPTYQQSASIPPSANPGGKAGRGVPDVCGDADPATGYTIRVDGETIPIGGTSAVAPLWAGLIALLNEGLGHPVGFLHPLLYSAPEEATLHDIVSGSNGAYSAKAGWDACSGLGSPDGAKLLAVLKAAGATTT